MKLISVSQMKKIEEEAELSGLSSSQMMENAGSNIAAEISENYERNDGEIIRVLGLVGPGNNGGDTLIALTRLAERGWQSFAYLIKRKTENDPLVLQLEEAGGEIYERLGDSNFQILNSIMDKSNILLDGILGTGTKLPLKSDIGIVLLHIKEYIIGMEVPPFVIAIDCPSGVDCDTGVAGEQTIPADITLTMAAMKNGLIKLPANKLAGDIKVIQIGDLNTLKTWNLLMDDVGDSKMISCMLPNRPDDAHKGSFGSGLIIAGSTNYTGAALLAGQAAARVGVGLVAMAIPAPLHSVLAGHFPEATWILLPHELGVISESAVEVVYANLNRVSAILLGPGLGVEDTTKEFVAKLLSKKDETRKSTRRMGFVKKDMEENHKKEEKGLPPMVIDADGLKIFAKIDHWYEMIPRIGILTPHPGEMSLLTSLSIDEIQADRINIARKYAQQWGHVVVLKGAFTVIASPDGKTTTIPVATSALAHAGTGDVLAGVITGLRAQGMNSYEAAIAGAWIHAKAGLLASEFVGNTASVLARDLLNSISDVLSEYY